MNKEEYWNLIQQTLPQVKGKGFMVIDRELFKRIVDTAYETGSKNPTSK